MGMRMGLAGVVCGGRSGCLSGPGVTLTGEAGAPRLTTPPHDPLSLVVIYSPEQATHSGAVAELHGQFPEDFTLAVPFPSGGAFEDKDGFSIAAGALWFARLPLSDPHGGFGDELVQPAGYYLIYLSDNPGSATPFGVSGMHEAGTSSSTHRSRATTRSSATAV